MIYGSVCSGIEAATVAWHPLGWKAAWLSEIEKFPSAVLQRHYPDIPNLGDMTTIHDKQEFKNGAIDLLVGGTPCQSFSIAGLRKGMADPRGNLALVFLALLDRKRPQWVVWENVPGVLSSWSDEAGSFEDEKGGRERGWQSNDFDTFTSGLEQLGYGLSWRVLDAQYFGVPQHRRRVFVVGYLGDWRPAAAVLFESHGLSGYPAPRRKAGEGIAGTISARTTGGGGLGTDFDLAGGLQIAHTLRGEGFDASEDRTGRGTPIVFTEQSVNQEACPTLLGHDHGRNAMNHLCIAFGSKDSGADAAEDLAPTLRAGTHDGSHANAGVPPAVCYDMRGNGDGDNTPTLTGHHVGAISDLSPVVFTQNSRSEVREMGDRTGAVTSEPGAQCQNYLKAGMAVRRLTPRECERLQGFPDDYTLIDWCGKPKENCPDGPRYKAIGNSMAVPVMAWIGRRIQEVEEL